MYAHSQCRHRERYENDFPFMCKREPRVGDLWSHQSTLPANLQLYVINCMELPVGSMWYVYDFNMLMLLCTLF